MKKLIFLLLLVTFSALPILAGPIRVSFKDSTILRGKTVYIPVWIDSNTTGLNIKSYELDINYTSSNMIIDSVISTGSMTASWQAPAFHLYSGRITVASAGTNVLDGTGMLVFLRLKLPLDGSGTYGYLQFTKAYFNEGTPSTVTRNGTITITNLPVITISPDNALLTLGDTRQFSVSGGKSPYTWSTTDSYVAGISGTGLLTAQHAGFCRVVVSDSNGVKDTTSQIEVRAFKLTIRDTSYLQGQTINIPIYISDLSLVDIRSGTFSVSYNANILTALGTIQTSTLLQTFPTPTTRIESGTITVAFAGDIARLNGVGTQQLIYLRFKITDVNTGGAALQFSSVMFSENLPGNIVNGYFNVLPRAILTISPNTATLVAGDSLQFSVFGEATPPVVWSVSDTSLGKISSTGKLKAYKSGIIQVSVTDFVGAKGISSNITLYDMRAQLLNVSGNVGDTVEVALQIGTYIPGIFSSQFILGFNQSSFKPVGIITTGTLFEGRMVAMGITAPGSVNLTAAGSTPVSIPGILFKIRFVISNSAVIGTYYITFTSTLFNEGKPLALTTNGQITISLSTLQLPALAGWNMISVPLTVNDYRRTVLYPGSASRAFEFQNGYIPRDTLSNRKGYWLKFNSAQTIPMSGRLLNPDTINVNQGWNMIGSINIPVRVSNITSLPGGIVASNFFKFNNGYFKSDTIYPGQGYWVNVNSSGKLILSSAFAKNASDRIVIVPSSEMPPDPPSELIGSGLLPYAYNLEQSYPNPFNPSTTIKYQLPFDSKISLKVFDLLGHEVATLVSDVQSAGDKSIEWNASGLASGVYFYKIEAINTADPSKTFTLVKKMTLMK
jgi:hypothetical protein